jgi:acyl carrier protein
MFVLYSSLTTIGNIGQSSYVAANLFLEALARRRRRAGLPALAVGLGALGETGVLTRGTQGEALARAGIEPMSPVTALAAVDDMLGERAGAGMVGRCDWGRLRRVLPALGRPWLSPVLPPGSSDTGPGQAELFSLLTTMDDEQAHAYVAGRITRLLSTVLLVPAEQIDAHRRLDEYGFDSIMATEMLARVRDTFAIDIPPMELVRGGGSVADLTQNVLLRIGRRPAPSAAEDDPGAARTVPPAGRPARPRTDDRQETA